MTNDTLVRTSFAIGVLAMAIGVWLNKLQGGYWSDLPHEYETVGFWTYFGGVGIVLVGWAVAEIFL